MPTDPTENVEVDIAEIVRLGVTDSRLFNKVFFPKTARVPSPPMHAAIDEVLDSNQRFINILMSRGWAKTSKLRMFTGKMIAYNLYPTIMFISASEKHSRRSLRWLMKQVEQNKIFAETFQLRKGSPWTPEEMQIIHGVEEQAINLVGMGITGSVRGVNLDDHRPHLIILDDIMNDETGESKRQIEKLADRVLGAVKESLAPESEAPLAKLVMLNTPQDFNDITQEASGDPEFVTRRFGCWTPETEDMPLEFRESAWPELIPSETLRASYRAAVARNRLSIFVREKECRLVAQEEAVFKTEWIQFFGEGHPEPEPPRHEMYIVLVIDPTPPPSDAELQKGLIDKDYEAMAVVGKWKGKYYILETAASLGEDPNHTTSEFFRLASKWRINMCWVETTAYQKTLEWLLREAMKKTRQYYNVQPFDDKKTPKHQRILQGISGPASNRVLYCRPEQTGFIDQYTHYSHTRKIKKDDELEAVAIALIKLANMGDFSGTGDDLELENGEYSEVSSYGGCP